MFFYTDTADAPWTVVKSDCKKRARINAMHFLLNGLDYPNKNSKVACAPDSLIVGSAETIYEAGNTHWKKHLWLVVFLIRYQAVKNHA